jgi:hypothetical protein
MPASTASLVLRNSTFRWSAPELFNDPFDVPRELSFGIEPKQMSKASAQRIAALIMSPPADTSDLSPLLRLIIDTVKRGISEKAMQALLSGLEDEIGGDTSSGESLEAMRTMWRNTLPNFRILCLTENPAHASMWHHYADQYRGVVIELRCVDELDSPWVAAKPVTYPQEKPLVYTAEGWAELLSLRQDLAIRRMLDLATYTKSPEWEYEAEWRLVSTKRPHEMGNHSDYKFHPDEIGGIYLGPRISQEDRESVAALAANYPNAKLWNVSIGKSRELQFSAAGG